MFQFIGSLFSSKRKQTKTPKDILAAINPGEIIAVQFKDPRTIGIVDPSGQLSKRFDPEDLIEKKLSGTLTNIRDVHGMTLIELTCNKMTGGARRERIYTLMLDELTEIRVLK